MTTKKSLTGIDLYGPFTIAGSGGTNGYFLKTDGSGNISWAAAPSSSFGYIGTTQTTASSGGTSNLDGILAITSPTSVGSGTLFADITSGTVNVGTGVTTGTVNIGTASVTTGTSGRTVNINTNATGTITVTTNIGSNVIGGAVNLIVGLPGVTLSGVGLLKTPDVTSASSNALTIRTGNSTTSGTSGSVTIDTGSGATAAGTISVGTSAASGISVGRAGITTTMSGTTSYSAGTTSAAPIKLTASASLASAVSAGTGAGAIDYDGALLYATPSVSTATSGSTATGRGIVPTVQLFYVNADSTVATAASATATGNLLNGKSFWLAANTVYEIEYYVHAKVVLTGSSAATNYGIVVSLPSGATSLINFQYQTGLSTAIIQSTTTAWQSIQASSTQTIMGSITAASTTYYRYIIKGTIKNGATAGYLLMQGQITAAAGNTAVISTLAGSYAKSTPIGPAGSDINVGPLT